MAVFFGQGSTTTLAKKIETGTQAKHRRVHARQITRLCHVGAAVSIFLARVVHAHALEHSTGSERVDALGPGLRAVEVIGASLSEPHTDVVTWDSVTRDIYIYIYLAYTSETSQSILRIKLWKYSV